MSSKARSLFAFARRRTIPAPEPRFDGRIEELEPRVLFNADVAALLPDPSIVTATMAANPTQAVEMVLPPSAVHEQASGTTAGSTAAPTQTAKPTEIIFVDARVPDAQQLMAQILSRQDGQHTLEIHWLSADRDGVAQITDTLAGRQDIAALHLISHGADGQVQLGSITLNQATLTQHLQQLSSWQGALSANADILLYGCDVAATEQGQRFVDDLSLLTGADVAASTDKTGAASQGGDWALEYAHGGIQALSLGASGSLAIWDHLLATTSFQDGASSYASTEDTQIILLAPGTDYSSSTTLYAGRDGAYSPSQALIKFNNIIGAGTGQIPQGSVITSVTLTINVGGGSSSTLAIYRMLGSWSETSTWTSLSSGVSMDNSEAKSSSDATASISGTSNVTLGSNAALIATVQAWVDNPSSNQGWVLDATNIMGNWNSRVTVQSSETATAGNRPKLSVTYTPPTPHTIDLDANNSSGAAGNNYSGAFTEQTALNVVDSDATISGGTAANLSTLTATISNLLDGTAESLAATTSGTSITASYNSGTGVLTLSGTDTVAHYQQVLRTIQYNNSSDNPTTTTRTINIVTTDAYGSTSNTAASSLTVTRVNDAPVITSNGGGASGSASVKETITAVTTVTATDVDSASLTYSISGGADLTKFSINSTTGVLTFVSAPDYEAPTDANADNVYLVTVQVSDGSLTDTQNLSVTVTDVSASLVVTTTADTNDSGLGGSFTAEQLNAVTGGTDTKVSLREAIIAANNTAGTDTITFNIATGTAGTGSDAGAYVITTASALPTLTQAVYINASTQSGYVAGGLHTVILDGGDAAAYGLDLNNAADGSTIRGLLIRNFTSYGIYVESGSDSNTIAGNFIGSFYADGTNSGAGTGNATAGIYIAGANTVVGGTTTADRNVISGNTGGYNVYLVTGANGTTISGNYIGLNASGGGVFSAVNPNYGIMIESSASNITIGGTATGAGNVISGHVREGIWVTTTGTVTIQGNYIGTNAAGTTDRGNGRYGIYLDDGGTAVIGGSATGAGNVISGNDLGGIYAANNGVTIQGNIIGLNATGTAALANTGSGIELRTAGASTIGGNGSGYRNVISGNTSHGIDVETDYAHTIKGNYIGVGSDGTTLLGNGGAGIYIAATGTTVGGKTAGDGNIIAGNGGAGIAVASGTNNLFYRNSIYSNTGIGIDLANDGVTANDLNDGDGGANWRNNFPVITSVVTNGSSTTIQGSIDWYHNAGQTIYIELFSSPTADPTGYGEGKTYLGTVTVTSNALGDATFSLTVSGVAVGDWVTAVANFETAAFGGSEFAKSVQAVAPANAPRGRLIWNGNDEFFQGYADWSTAGFSDGGTNGIAYGDDISMIGAWEAPSRNEILFIGSADVSGKILAGIWNGSTWSSVISIPLSNPAAGAAKYDSFAVAYDQVSGDAMLVWDNGNSGTTGLSYATYNGTTWSSIGTITAPVSGEPLHMKLVSNPRGHDMVLAVQNSSASNNQYAMVWNGSSWGNAQTLGTNTNEQYFELNVAYESQSGKAMVVYDASASNSSNAQYRIWSGSSWGSENTITAAAGVTATSDLYSTAIASDPTSNRIAIAAKDAANEVWLSVWDGSSWGSSQLATASGVGLTEDHPTMAVAFESQSGELLAVYGKSAGPNIYYRTWTSGGGWSAEGTGPSMGGTDIPYVAKLYADPYTNTIMLGVQDNASDLHMAAWDGSAWGTVTQIDSDTGFTYRENFTYVWYQNSVVLANVHGDTLAYTEDQSAQVIDQGTAATVTMSDETLYNSGNLTVSFTAGSTSGEDVLAIRNQGSGAGQIGLSGANVTYAGTTIGTYTGGTSGANLVITLNANATNAAVTALVKNITYQNTNTTAPSTTNRTVRFVATNALGQASTASDVTVTVTAVNDAPTNTVPGAQSVNEDATLVFSSGNGNLISIADVDAGSSSMQVTLTVTNGTLTLSGITGLSFSAGDGTADATMTFTGTISAINTALAGMGFTPTGNYNGSATLSIVTSDQGNAGSGGTQTDSDTVNITVNAVNDAPVNSVPGAQSTNEDTSLTFSSGNSNLISISDVDAASGNMQVTLSVSNGTLTLSGTTGLSFTAGDGTTDSTMTFTGTVSAINTALAGLVYAPTGNYNGSDTLTITTSDQGNTGSGGTKTDSDTVAITVSAVNDAPVNSVPAAQSTNEDTNLTFSSGNSNLISISDVDAASGSLQVTLSVAHGSLTLSGTTGLSFTAGDGTADGTMTFTGTASAINTALAGLVYTPTGDYNGSDTLTITTSDQGNTGSGGAKTDSDTVAITVNAVNDAPINSVPGAQSVNEDATLTFSSGNGNLVSISDVDAASGNMQVTLTVTNGTLTLSGITGLSFTAGDGTADTTMTFTGTVSAINTALAGMGYAPTGNYNGAATLTIVTSDQGNTGSGGAKTDSDTVNITVNAVNDAPVNSVPAAQSTNEDTSLTFSSGNSNLISISDVDAASSSVQVTLTVTNGTLSLSGVAGLSFSAGDGTTDTTMTFTGTVTAINTALAGLVYAPTGNYNGSALLTITTSDQGNIGSGGTLTDTDTVSITVNAVNDAPVNSVPGAQSTNEDTSLTFSSGNSNLISISDVDASSGSMQVTISVTNGTLSLSGVAGLSFTAGDGTTDTTMTFTGTVSAINTALAGLVYAPTGNYNGSATLTITTSDQGNTGSGGAKTDTDTVTITVNAVNDAPVNTKPGAQTINEDATLTFSSGNGNTISIADVDAGGSAMKLTLSVTNGTLTLSGITGLTFTTGDGTADATMVFTGTRTNINNALAGLTFTPTANYSGSAVLSITSDDQGNTGSGGAKTDVDTVTITINPVNDAPTATITPPTYSATEQVTLVLQGTGLSIADVDAASSTVQATLSVVSGALTVGAGTSGVTVGGSGTNSVTLTGTLTQINNLLAGNGGATISYLISSDAPPGSDTLTLLVSDQGNTGSGGTLTGSDTATINITAVNDAPTATITAPSYSVVENMHLTLENTGLSVADPDGSGVSVQVTLNVDIGALTIAAGTTGVTVGGSGTDTVTLNGTIAQINNLLSGAGGATLSYINNSGTPTASALLTLGIDDLGNTGGGHLTASSNVAINVVPAAAMGSVGIPGSASDIGAYYGFDTGANLGRDDSAGGHNMTLIGTPGFVVGHDGRNSALSVVNDDTGGGTLEGGDIAGLSTGGAMTISVWVKFDSFNTASGGADRIIDFGQANATGIGNIVLARDAATQQISFILQHDNLTQDICTLSVADSVQVGQWAHIAATVDSSGLMKIYLNGTGSGTLQGTALATGVRDHNYVAQSNKAGTYGMNGAVDDLLVANRAMSANEIAALYNPSNGLNVYEKSANGTAIGTVRNGSSIDGRTVTYSLLTSGGGRFAIDSTTGQITVADSANLLHSGASSYTISVRALDSGGFALDTSYTINLLNINDAPVGTSNTVTTLEDTPYVFGTADFGFTDPNDTSGNALLAVKITSVPASGSLTLNGVAVSTNDVISAADIISGKLQFTPAADANGTGYSSFGFKVRDDGGTANNGVNEDSTARTMTVNVTSVNDAPHGAHHTATTLEDTPYVFATSDFGFTDSDGNALQAVKITGLPAAGSLTLNGVAVSNNDVILASDIAAGKLVFTAAADANGAGYASFTFKVQDDGGTASGGVDLAVANNTMTMDVTAVNDAPQGSDNTVSTNEDTPYVFHASDFGFTDTADSPANALQGVKLSTLPASGTLTLNGVAVSVGQVISLADINSGLLVFTPSANANGAGYASLGFQVQDDGGTANGGDDLDNSIHTLTIDVNAVNDAPTTQSESVSGNEDNAIVGMVTGADVDGDGLSFSKATDPTHGAVVVASNGSFTYTPVANFNGSDSFTVTVSDGHGGTATSTVTVTVNAVNDAPMANNPSVSGNEDNTINGSVTGSDVDGDTLSYTKFSDPTHGTAIVNSDGTFSYTPTANFNGSDSFTVTVSDGHSGTTSSTVNITVNPVNDSPTTNDVAVSGNEDNAITGSVTGGDVDGDTLVFTKTANPSHGSVNVAADGSFTYTPTANFHGSDSFTVLVSDGHGGTASSTVTITVASVNDAPSANNPSLSGAEDQPITGSITGSDVDGDTLSYAKASDPTHGIVNVASDGSFTYTPTANFHGSDSFTVLVDDGHGGTITSTITLTVSTVNDAPVANNPAISGAEDSVLSGQITASDVDGDSLGYLVTADATHGQISLASDGSFTYTPDADFHGSDTFTVRVDDGQGGTATSTITVTVTPVNDAPTANNPSVSGTEDNAIIGQVTAGDVDGDTLSYSQASAPTHGSVAVRSDGSFTYTPTANFNGSDSFTVLVDDGHGGTTTSTISVSVAAVNDAPTTNNPSVSGSEDNPIIGQITASDVDGDTLSYSQSSAPTHGSVAVRSDGSFTYTPTANFNGSDSFTVLVDDGNGGTTTSTITVTVAAVNDAPIANNPSVSGSEDNPIIGQITASDVDGDTLSYSQASAPTHGSVSVRSDGSFTYTPTANFNGSDSFTVLVDDGHGGTTTSTITVTVAAVNDAPTTGNVNASGAEDMAITGNVTGSDVDGDALSFTKATDPVHGSVAVQADGSFTYTPTANYNGSDSFTVLVSDGHGGTSTATVTLTVTPANDAPIAVSPSFSGNEDQAISGSVTGTDVDGDTLSYVKGSDPLHGTVLVNSNGSFTYTPTANYNGSDSFTVTISDGHGGSTSALVSLSIAAVNDAPIAIAPGTPYAATEQVSLNLANTGLSVSDPDAGNSVIQVAISVTSGTLSVTAGSTGVTIIDASSDHITLNGTVAQLNALLSGSQGATLSYLINQDAPPATDLLTLHVDDLGNSGSGGAQTMNASALIQITAVNDAPVMTPGTQAGSASPSITWSTGALLNGATDPDGNALTIRVVQAPQHGTVVVSNGQVTYTTSPGYVGSDSFSYEAYNGQMGSGSTSTMNVQASSPMPPPITTTTTPTVDDNAPSDQAGSSNSKPTADENQDGAASPADSVAKPASIEEVAKPIDTEASGSDGEGKKPSSLHERVAGASWIGNNKGNDAAGSLRQALFTPGFVGNYGVAAGFSLNTGSPVIQLLDLIKPTIERVQDINLALTPLSSVTHALPAQTAAEADNKTGDATSGPAIKFERMATYSTGLGLSIGTIWWTARISGLVTSALISTPAWRSLDPLPVLTSPTGDQDDDEHDADSHLGDREVEHLFDGDKPMEQDMPVIQ